MKAKLTTKLLDSLIAKGEPHAPIWDTVTSGFQIRMSKRGVPSFSAMRRLRGGSGKPIRVPCGVYPLVSLADGRARATEALRDLAAGTDPRQLEAARLQAADRHRNQNAPRTAAGV
jgi:hypothetical protein